MAKYQGHDSRAAWNVSLWINNHEGLYNLARGHARRAKTLDIAAQAILADLNDSGLTETPDGFRFTKTSIRKAIADIL